MSVVAGGVERDVAGGYSDVPGDASAFGARMDRLPLTWLHIGIVALASLGFVFDLMELALGNVLSAVFSAAPYSVAPGQLSWLLAAMYIGAIPGALASGWFADRFGRRGVLASVLLILAATSVAAAASPDIDTLIVCRVLSGLALGAYPPLIVSFLTDLLPPRRRGTLIMVSTGIAAFGPVAVVFLVRALTPIQPLGVEGWRWAFLMGAVGALAVAIAFRWLPESPRWLAAAGRPDEAERALARFERSPAALANPVTADLPPVPATSPDKAPEGAVRRFVLIGAMYFFAPWATVAFPLLMGAVLIEKGFALSDSLLYVGIALFGPPIGTLLSSLFFDRIERRLAIILLSLGLIGSAVGFAASLEPLWLMVTSIAFQVLGMVHVPTLTVYTAELYPTAWRARASTAAWSINRLAAAMAPLVLLPLLKLHGVWAMTSVMIAALVLGILVVLAAPKGKAGRAVD